MPGFLECLPTIFKSTKPKKRGRPKKNREDLKCWVCERAFSSNHNLEAHINRHFNVRPHKCEECESRFTTKADVNRHIKQVHSTERPLKCDECDYATVQKCKLTRHIRIHTGERPYQCNHCTYAAMDMFNLKRHIRVHTGERPYACDCCAVRFTQANALKLHKNYVHGATDMPKINCQLCPFRCLRKRELHVHEKKMHSTDEIRRICSKCGLMCTDQHAFKTHAKIHEEQKPKRNYFYRCKSCSFSSRTQRDLKAHKDSQHKDTLEKFEIFNRELQKRKTMHVCNICSRVYTYKAWFLRHMTKHQTETGTNWIQE